MTCIRSYSNSYVIHFIHFLPLDAYACLAPSGVLPNLPTLTQRKAFELIWYMPIHSLSASVLAFLAQCVSCRKFDKSCMCYLVQIVHNKYVLVNYGITSMQACSCHFSPVVYFFRVLYQGSDSSIPQYISFMLSLCVG